MSSNHCVPLTTKFGYGVGQMSEGMLTITFSLFILFFYTQLLGVPGSYTGGALFIALIFDAISDPWMGVISDHTHSKWGRRHPYMLFSALPLVFSFYLLFSPPTFLLDSDLGLAAWLTVFAIITRLLMTLFQVPYLSLGAELSQDFNERTKIVGFRYAFSNIGVIAAIMLGFNFFFIPTEKFSDGQMNPEVYPSFALTLGILVAISILITVFSTACEIPRLSTASKKPKKYITTRDLIKGHFNNVVIALHNYSFRWLLFSIIIAFVMVGIVNSLNVFMATFFWELKDSEISTVLSSIIFGILIGVFFTPYLHNWLDKKKTVLYSVTGWAVFLILPATLRLLGLFPENHSESLFWILIFFRILEGLCLVQAAVSFGSMLADIADEHALNTGKREEGIFFGASSFASKCSDGLGTLVAGVALDLINFPTGAEVKAIDIDPATLYQLGMIYGPLMTIFAIASLWCCNHYILNRKRHQQILQELHHKNV